VRPDVRPYFIGAQRGIERDVLPTTEFPHTLLDLHPLYRRTPWKNVTTLRTLVSGWRDVGRLAKASPPALVVATGGYASSATLAWAVASRTPFVVQEQNAWPGKTVRWFSRWAREVYVGFPEAMIRLPAAARPRTFDLGNPIEPPPVPRPASAAARERWGFAPDVRLVVLAFGGSQGSAALNGLVDAWVGRGLPPGVGLVWGTGRAHAARYASRERDTVRVRAYIAPMADAYAAADLAIGRAGAMTTAELCAWGIPMFLVPLPTAAADHQTVNARALAESGAARWTPEAGASADAIDGWVREMLDPAAREHARQAAQVRARPDAAGAIAARIAGLLSSPHA
jgi:UDP-N-acetylglucosamine--N-acetylmuramyl-(pentapeptide) pyrophosphoryl-undecaprenol N-acetylglucosamine transferase